MGDLLSEMGDLEVKFGILLVEVAHLCLEEGDSLGLMGLVDEELFVLELEVAELMVDVSELLIEMGELLLEFGDCLVGGNGLVGDDVDGGFAGAV